MSAFTNLGVRVIDNDGNLVASRDREDWTDTFMGKRWFRITLEEHNGKRYYVTPGSYLDVIGRIYWDIGVIKRNLDIYMELGVWSLQTFSHVVDLFTLLERGWAFTNEYVLDHLYDVVDFENDNPSLSIEEFFYQVGMGVINYGQGEMAGTMECELNENDDFGSITMSGLDDFVLSCMAPMTDDVSIPREVLVGVLEAWQPDPDDDVTVSDASGHVVIDLTSVPDVIDLTSVSDVIDLTMED
jgi:hypothetical protein